MPQRYPQISFLNEQIQKRECEECKCTFWHIDSKVKFCGDLNCNREDLPYKKFRATSEELSKKTPGEFFKDFKNYFKNVKASCFNKTHVLRRNRTYLRHTSTNMNFMTAGISAFDTLLCVNNPRIQTFAKDLLISNQFCYRFQDDINVGTTLRHNTGFFMLSLHCFESFTQKFQEDWKKEFFNVILTYLVKELQIPLRNIYVHADSWTDNVNNGSSLEFFINGIEIGNCVFTEDYLKEGPRPLKFLDVGIGGERLYELVSNRKVPYFKNKDSDYLRSLIVAFHDKIYPSKIGLGYNIRKINEYFLKKNLFTSQSIRSKAQPIIEDLEACTEQDFKDFYTLYDYICPDEYKRCKSNKIL
jgi:alanyl-tRNA synthetase